MTDEREEAERTQRNAACFEACAGIPTEALERIATLPPPERPAALAEAARRKERAAMTNSL